jgi:hypothetical protein
MTRIKTVRLPCPECRVDQEVSVVLSWNEGLSGPAPEDAWEATCIECGHRFDPVTQIEHWEDVERPLTWGERLTVAFVVTVVLLLLSIPFLLLGYVLFGVLAWDIPD